MSRSARSNLLNYFTFYCLYHLSVFFVSCRNFLYCLYVDFRVLVGILLAFYNQLYVYKHTQNFTFQLENDRRFLTSISVHFYCARKCTRNVIHERAR